MRILALERPVDGITEGDCAPWLRAEAMQAWELYRRGDIRELYFRPDTHEAILVLECTDVNEAHSILARLPLVEQNLIRFEVIPLGPYTGFERLQTQDHTQRDSER
jgi:muconolactone delta-isomerase